MFFQDDIEQGMLGQAGQLGQASPEATLRRQIPVHAVFELDPPNRHGDLQSKVLQCMRVGELKHHLDRAEVVATTRASNPAIVMNRKDPPVRRGSQTFATSAVRPGSGEPVPGVEEVAPEDHEEMLRVEAYSNWVNRGGVPGMPRTPQGFYDAMDLSRAKHDGVALRHTERVRLPVHYELTHQVPALEPKHYMDVVAGYEERVGMIFGVPRSFWAQFSANKATNSQASMLCAYSGRCCEVTRCVLMLPGRTRGSCTAACNWP